MPVSFSETNNHLQVTRTFLYKQTERQKKALFLSRSAPSDEYQLNSLGHPENEINFKTTYSKQDHIHIDHEEPKHSTINFIQTDNEDEDINI